MEDLKDIREMMSKSSRFISLSGLAGIGAGVVALIGAYLAHRNVFADLVLTDHQLVVLSTGTISNLLFIVIGTIFLAVAVTVFFSSRHLRKKEENIWDHQTKRMVINLLIPLVTGGLLCLLMIYNDLISMTMSLTLIFYGLALVNSSKYTYTEIRSLGIIEIILGLVAFQYVEYGLIIWAIGFGLMHVVYGIYMHLKYKS